MGTWYERWRLLCPRCGYDVGQTLRDGFRICPECGTEIDEDRCARDVDQLPRRVRAAVYITWAMAFPMLALTTLEPWLAVWCAPAAAGPVYAGWWWVERWLAGGAAWKRAIGPALAVLVIEEATVLAGCAAVWTLGLL